MKKQFFKIIGLLAVLGAVFTACQKDEENITSQTEKTGPIDVATLPVENGELTLKSLDLLKGASLYNHEQKFVNQGFVAINENIYTTTVIGNQRWICGYIKVSYQNGVLDADYIKNSTTGYYSYESAMSYPNEHTVVPMYQFFAVVEKSNWRIPSKADINDLNAMAMGNEAIVNALQMTATGIVHCDPDDAFPDEATVWASNYGASWMSYTLWANGNLIYNFFCSDSPTHVGRFEGNSPNYYAPIRLVQNIEPVD